METVAGEKPVACATSRMVTSPRLGPVFFMGMPSRAHHRAESGPVCNAKEWRLLFGRHFEGKLLAEAFRLPNAEGDARGHPDGADDDGGTAEIHPQSETNDEADHGRNQEAEFFLGESGRSNARNAATLTPMKAIKAPKLSISAPKP